MTSAPQALANLAEAFGIRAASAPTDEERERDLRSRDQLVGAYLKSLNGTMSTAEAWSWADAGAGQLAHRTTQLDRKALA